MSLTYRAVQVTEPGKLELVNRPIPETPAGKVRLRVEACGICHTDGGTVYNAFPGLTPCPPVPPPGPATSLLCKALAGLGISAFNLPPHGISRRGDRPRC